MHPFLERVFRGEAPPLDAFVDALGDALPLLLELRRTPQDPVWHGEGDVHAHTELVLGGVYRQLGGEAAGLGPIRRLALILGAVLHDIGKPLTTRVEEAGGRERIVAPRHADRGRSFLAYKLPGLGLPHRVTRAVLALVGHHHDPKRLVLGDAPAREYRRLARLADLELLYRLELADMGGRACADREEQLEIVELFRLYAEEHGVWGAADPYGEWRAFVGEALADQPPAFRELALAESIKDFEAGVIATPHEAVARSFARRGGFPQLLVTYGPSGSGKSAWAGEHAGGDPVVSLDDLRVRLAAGRGDQSANGRVLQAAKEELRAALRARRRVIWDATNLRRDFRNVPLGLGFDYGALVTLVVFHLPEGEVFARNPLREHAVPPGVVAGQLTRAEFPYATEAHRTVYVDGYGAALHREGFAFGAFP